MAQRTDLAVRSTVTRFGGTNLRIAIDRMVP